MIGCFPTPYPDETLYSICARYSCRMQYPVQGMVNQELFGNNGLNISGLPRRLVHLVSALPAQHPCANIDYILNNHTLLPLYKPFLSSENFNDLRYSMITMMEVKDLSLIKINSFSFIQPLRFCVACVQEDRREFGECYWHRVHQVVGVYICPKHKLFLEYSTVNQRKSRNRFFDADSSVQIIPTKQMDPSDNVHEILLMISKSVKYLLNYNETTINIDLTTKRYMTELATHQFATPNGILRTRSLLPAIQNYFSIELLILLNSRISNNHNLAWPLRLRPNSTITQHPIRHLLFIQFLGYKVEDFFKLNVSAKPLGEGPWPCLNAVCTFYKQPSIKECEIRYTKKFKDRPSGIFRCECGFVYVRLGPDKSIDDKYRIGQIRSFGYIWEKELRRVWSDSTMSMQQCAIYLGVTRITVKRQAFKLKLPFPSAGTKILQPKQTISSNSQANLLKKREDYRTRWLSTIQENPSISKSELAKVNPTARGWLDKHDHEWFIKHSPPTKRHYHFTRKTNWADLDIQLMQAVSLAITSIKEQPECPVRVSKSAICRILGRRSFYAYDRINLPLTTKLVTESLETFEDFAIRRIQWYVEYYRKEEVTPSRTRLIARASVEHKKHIPKISAAIDEALTSFTVSPSKDD